jgi:hypothetical protein
MMVLRLTMIGVVLCMLIVAVRGKGGCHGQGARARRRHHARELGDHEQADQQADEPGYRPQPLQRMMPLPVLPVCNYPGIPIGRQRHWQAL